MLAMHQLVVDHGWRVVAGVYAFEGRIGHDAGILADRAMAFRAQRLRKIRRCRPISIFKQVMLRMITRRVEIADVLKRIGHEFDDILLADNGHGVCFVVS